MFLRNVVYLATLICATSAALVAADDPSADAETIARLVAELDSDEYAVREEATRALIESGAVAVAPLGQAAAEGSLETVVRAIRVLHSLYTGDDDRAVDAAEEALETLSRAENISVATRAEQVLDLHEDVRQRRAVAKITELGGIVKYYDSRLMARRVPGNQPDAEHPVEILILDRDWKGGDKGLKYVKRLTDLQSLLVVRGTGVSKRALDDLQATFPDLQIQERGPAYLGVKMRLTQQGCRILEVTEGSAAEVAGLQPNDLVVGFDGQPVTRPDELIDFIGQQKPGGKVQVVVNRGGQRLTIDVVMGEWSQEQ